MRRAAPAAPLGGGGGGGTGRRRGGRRRPRGAMFVKKVKNGKVWTVNPGEWEQEEHYYPRALNAQLHPLVTSFLGLDKLRIATRYCHLHPETDKNKLLEVLGYVPRDFRWAGADLFCVTNEMAQRQMIVIETNSCPSGQKSMPSQGNENDTAKGTNYYTMVAETFGSLLREKSDSLPEGVYATIFDKNPMEATGYAQCMADFLKTRVFIVEMFRHDDKAPYRWRDDGVLEIRVGRSDAEHALPDTSLFKPVEGDESRVWVPVRAAFRYVTIAPWTRIPVVTKTLVLNPIISCLSGGRNKLVASKAYDFKNAELSSYGLRIRTPETITDVSLTEIPLYVRSMGYIAVIKVPYSNAGQGVFTITSKAELDSFMEWAKCNPYDQFIVQALVGNSTWSSASKDGIFYHVGTVPNVKNKTYVADLRMMICATEEGYRPLAIYARRAKSPLTEKLLNVEDSWDMLGTNLSVLNEDGSWGSDTSRLLLMDRKDFNRLGISLDDLIDSFIQTVLASTAIDQMCKRLLKNGTFEHELFASLNKDPHFIDEVLILKDVEAPTCADDAAGDDDDSNASSN
mmetsp:Transcript_17705/g.56549  ORF Transcript_17705/g.56549 Transcript_17705/m.56549 type:complete len:569 (+) Transcript_17705:1887-3593(+)